MYRITKEEVVFKDKLVIEAATIIYDNSEPFTRLKLKRQDAAVVLLLDTGTEQCILTKQFRYPIASETKDHILEAVAGKLDPGESPLEAATRETEEETGYRVKPNNIQLLTSCFSSPGYTSECFYIYFATVSHDDKVSEGGGKKEEHEYIGLEAVAKNDFKKMILDGAIKDAKTYVAGLMAMSRNLI